MGLLGSRQLACASRGTGSNEAYCNGRKLKTQLLGLRSHSQLGCARGRQVFLRFSTLVVPDLIT